MLKLFQCVTQNKLNYIVHSHVNMLPSFSVYNKVACRYVVFLHPGACQLAVIWVCLLTAYFDCMSMEKWPLLIGQAL